MLQLIIQNIVVHKKFCYIGLIVESKFWKDLGISILCGINMPYNFSKNAFKMFVWKSSLFNL